MAKGSIPTAEYLRQVLEYLPLTGELIWRVRPRDHFVSNRGHATWNARYAGKAAGSTHGCGYLLLSINKHRLLAHRIIWSMVYGQMPTVIDHMNGDRKDNRLCNLRQVVRTQNSMNAVRRSDNKSGVTGVWRCTKTEKWNAAIRAYGQRVWIGRFATIEQAAAARAVAEAKMGFSSRHGTQPT